MRLGFKNPYTDKTVKTTLSRELEKAVSPLECRGAVEDAETYIENLLIIQTRLLECLVENGTIGFASLNYILGRAEYNGILQELEE